MQFNLFETYNLFSVVYIMPIESSCDVDLPPDVVSTGSGSADVESPVELPETADYPCCKKSCLDKLPKAHKESAEKMKLDLEKLDPQGKNTIWFNQLLNMNREHPEGQRRRMFFWQGHALCLNGFSFLTGCNCKKIRGFLKLIAQGECVPPMDGRVVPRKRPEIKRHDVDSFFCFLYEHLAEPLANLRDTSGDEAVDSADAGTAVAMPTWMQDLESVLQTVVVVSEGKPSKSTVQKRWLPTMTPAELFDLYRDMHQTHEALASQATFHRIWRGWQSVLGIRAPQVHSHCDDCAKYSFWSQESFFLHIYIYNN